MNVLVDFFEIDKEEVKKGKLTFLGNENNLYASSCANYLNLQPNQYEFTKDGTLTRSFLNIFEDTGVPVSVDVFTNYLTNVIIERGYPLVSIEQEQVGTTLETTISLNNSKTFIKLFNGV